LCKFSAVAASTDDIQAHAYDAPSCAPSSHGLRILTPAPVRSRRRGAQSMPNCRILDGRKCVLHQHAYPRRVNMVCSCWCRQYQPWLAQGPLTPQLGTLQHAPAAYTYASWSHAKQLPALAVCAAQPAVRQKHSFRLSTACPCPSTGPGVRTAAALPATCTPAAIPAGVQRSLTAPPSSGASQTHLLQQHCPYGDTCWPGHTRMSRPAFGHMAMQLRAHAILHTSMVPVPR
jgi:hypothetical protein